MSRGTNRLSARKVETTTRPGRYADGLGLYLVVAPAGAKKWSFLYRRAGKRREMGLGSVAVVPLVEARRKAREAAAVLAAGRDPLSEKRAVQAEQQIPTFLSMADELISIRRPSWRNAKHAAQWEATLARYAEPIFEKRVDDISLDDVLAILTPIWQAKPETAHRVRGRIEAVLAVAIAKGFRARGDNPATWRNNLDVVLPKRPKLSRGHHGALPYPDAPAFMRDLAERDALAARALEFLILTAARTGEVIGARWSEFDLHKAIWTVPADRMKAGVAHRVPLSPSTLAALEATKAIAGPAEADGFVFPGPRRGHPMSNMALLALLKRMARIGVTVHGFRSTFRTWAAECTAFPHEIAEAALAHTVGEAVVRAYRRTDFFDRRRALMDAWAGFLTDTAGTNVVILHR